MLYLLLFTFICQSITKLVKPSSILLALNCGSFQNVHSQYGVYFKRDTNYTKSYSKDYQSEIQEKIRYTNDNEILSSQRYFDDSFSYYLQIPLQQIQDLVIILFFAELQYTEKRQRIFNVSIGNTTIIYGLDIYAKVGGLSNYQEYIVLSYNYAGIYYKNNLIKDALTLNNQIILKFSSLYGDAIINGIMIVNGTLQDTDYEDQDENTKQYELQYLVNTVNEKQEQILKLRPGYESQIQQETNSNNNLEFSFFSLQVVKALLLTPFGLLGCLAFSIMTFVLIAFAFFQPYGNRLDKLKKNKKMIKFQNRQYHQGYKSPYNQEQYQEIKSAHLE